MYSRFLINLRNFSTSVARARPKLSAEYTSKQLWDERYKCKLLSDDESMLRSINSKIIVDGDLNNLEVDIFINIATPHSDEVAQLQESAKLLRKFRKTLEAHTLLPSTPQALCRLFLYSQRLPSLITILENRVTYGIFPDFYSLNLLLDKALNDKDYVSASRLAALVMYQEEFGINPITDRLALYSLAKYIESKTSFDDWQITEIIYDAILNEQTSDFGVSENKEDSEKKEPKKDEGDEEDEDEEDAEYIRIPFLRNPYNDNHFDIKKPRIICGKTLSMLGKSIESEEPELGVKSSLFGDLLQGKWSSAIENLAKCGQANYSLGSSKDVLRFYVDNLDDLEGPSEEQKASIESILEKLSDKGSNLSSLTESKYENINQMQQSDIEGLRKNFSLWSELRFTTKRQKEEKIARAKLISEIKLKKEELERKEQYLYFYDNLRKSRITRIEYN